MRFLPAAFLFKDAKFLAGPDGSIYSWAGRVRFGVTFSAPEAGQYRLKLEAAQWDGKVPAGYAYEFTVYLDGGDTGQVVKVPARGVRVASSGEVVVTVSEAGDHTLTFQWSNDVYLPEQGIDANLQVLAIETSYETSLPEPAATPAATDAPGPAMPSTASMSPAVKLALVGVAVWFFFARG